MLAVSEVEGELEQATEITADWWAAQNAVRRLHDRRPTWVRKSALGDAW